MPWLVRGLAAKTRPRELKRKEGPNFCGGTPNEKLVESHVTKG